MDVVLHGDEDWRPRRARGDAPARTRSDDEPIAIDGEGGGSVQM